MFPSVCCTFITDITQLTAVTELCAHHLSFTGTRDYRNKAYDFVLVVPRVCTQVIIRNDRLLEDEEQFSLSLQLVGGVTLLPRRTTVRIQDDESELSHLKNSWTQQTLPCSCPSLEILMQISNYLFCS